MHFSLSQIQFRRLFVCLFVLLFILISTRLNIAQASEQTDQLSWSDAPIVPHYRPHSSQTDPTLLQSVSYRELQVGDQQPFWIPGRDDDAPSTMILQARTPHANFWFESAFEIDMAELEKTARFFEEQIWMTNQSVFGLSQTSDPVNIVNLSRMKSSMLGAFDPTNRHDTLFINLKYAPLGSDVYLSTIAHEHQHLLSYQANKNEPRWLSEGLAQLAEHLNGFQVEDHKLKAFLNIPDHHLHGWSTDGVDIGRYYGASFLFMLYLYEQFGSDIIERIINSPYDGLAAVEDSVKHFGSVNTIFANWIVANYLNSYQSIDLPSSIEPKLLQITDPALNYQDSVHQYGADYLQLETPGTYRIGFDGEDNASIISKPPPNDDTIWWSYDNSNSVTRLTGAFDLTEVDTATLVFDAWWDIHPDYDWLQIKVSEDDGATWHIVSGKRARNGHYTGTSTIWVRETIDLSAFVGNPILIQFEYVTGPAQPLSGVALNQIHIPELESQMGSSEWLPHGFMRISASVEQQWTLSIIHETHDGQTSIHRLGLDHVNKGYTEISIAEDEKVTIVIGAMTPFSHDRASYTVSLESVIVNLTAN